MAENKQQEETPNPYNAKKAWHNSDDKPFISSESIFYGNQPEQVEAVKEEVQVEQETVQDKPYKKPNYKKRYDDMKSHYDKKLNEWRQEKEELLNEVSSNRPEYKAPKSPEELEQFKEQYPEVFEVVETVSHMQSEKRTQELEEKLQTLQLREAEKTRIEAENSLIAKHPDFDDIRNSEDFTSWTSEQPIAIRDWITTNADDAELAARILDLYKKDRNIEPTAVKKSNSKKTKASAADMVSTKTTTVEPQQDKIWSQREISALSMDEFDKLEDEINKAWTEGRIVN
mgnify:CR=1 FL=1|tara:strand:+ start:531 stop:1388 length:858 start_codon:yes stop_codon:yes gene_type:complete